MPILKPETVVFPDNVFSLPFETHPWWVAHMKSRREKRGAREAMAQDIPFYLPLFERIRRNATRQTVSWVPLFPGYLFFRGSLTDRLEVLRTNMCVSVLTVADQEGFARDIDQVRRLELLGHWMVPHPFVGVGDLVRIEEGPFRGYTGKVLRQRGRERLVVSVPFIHRSVSVELRRDALAPVPETMSTAHG